MKKLTILASLIALASVSACTTSAPAPVSADGTSVEVDKGISGDVEGNLVGSKTKIAVFGAFSNITSGNLINVDNKTIEADTTLVVAPVADGKYEFGLPKAPQKADAANFRIFAFNDENDNNLFDEGEPKSKEGSVKWARLGGYSLATDADGNNVLDPLGDFKDFDFKFNGEAAAEAPAEPAAE